MIPGDEEPATLIGYKFCRYDSKLEKLCSVMIDEDNPAFRTYEVGKETRRRNGKCYGPLAVFGTLEDARDMATRFRWDTHSEVHCFKCEYDPSADICIKFRNYSFLDGNGEAHMAPSRSCNIKKLPRGTILADSVTLLEEVQNWR